MTNGKRGMNYIPDIFTMCFVHVITKTAIRRVRFTAESAFLPIFITIVAKEKKHVKFTKQNQ